MNLRVALCQIDNLDNIDCTLEKGLDAVNEAYKNGADIAVFPEMFSNGYKMSYDINEMEKLGIPKDHYFIKRFADAARKLSIAVCITYLLKADNKFYNALSLFNRFGNEVYTYKKVHTCDFDVERVLARGEDFYVGDLDTKIGIIKVGSMICYDREFPESARILMLKGAELLLVPNACPMEINRISQLRGRAYENMIGIVTVNYPKTHIDCNGHSTVFDGVVYKEGNEGARDTLVFEAGEEEGVFISDISISDIRLNRENEIHGNCFRRPDLYKILIESKINKPFIRKEYRK